MTSVRSLRGMFIVGLLALSLAAYFAAVYEIHLNIVDDAYISFRYAQHLAEGNGLVWNIGAEPTEGYSNFLWVVILGGAHAAGFDIETVAPLLMVATTLMTAGLFVWMLHRHLGSLSPIAVAVVAIYLADPFTAVHTVSGLETLMAAFFVTASLAAVLELQTRPSLPAAVAVGVLFWMSILTRPDMALFAATMSLGIIAAWRRITLRFVAVALGLAAVLTSVYAIWKLRYFGYLLPNPFYVKTPSSLFALAGLRHVLQYFDHLVRETWPLWVPMVLAALLRPRALAAACREANAALADPRTRAMALALLAPLLLGCLYYTTIIHEVGFASRFSFPTYPLFVLGGAVLAAWLARRADIISKTIETAIVLLVMVNIAGRSNWRLNVEPAAFPADFHAALAAPLTQTGLGAKIGVHFMAAGLIPYRSGVNHVDPVGLVDNGLCGRMPLTRDEYEQLLWSRATDVYFGPEPPATVGATSAADEPLMARGYVPHLIGEEDPAYALAWRHPRFGPIDAAARAEFIHRRMRRLRDEWIWVGEYRPKELWERLELRLMIFVRRDSPYRDQLIAALDPIADVAPSHDDLSRVTPAWVGEVGQ